MDKEQQRVEEVEEVEAAESERQEEQEEGGRTEGGGRARGTEAVDEKEAEEEEEETCRSRKAAAMLGRARLVSAQARRRGASVRLQAVVDTRARFGSSTARRGVNKAASGGRHPCSSEPVTNAIAKRW